MLKKLFNSAYLRNFCIVLGLILVAASLNHGSTGGDEGRMIQYGSIIAHSNSYISSYIDLSNTEEAVNNHIAWITISSIFIRTVDAVSALFGSSLPTPIFNWLLAFFPAFAAIVSGFFIYKYLKICKISNLVSIITVLFIYVCTPISSFLTGGWSECYLLFFISIKLFTLEWISNRKPNNLIYPITLGAIDFMIIIIKAYSFIWIILIIPILLQCLKKREFIAYIITVTSLCFLFLLFKLNLYNHQDSNLIGPSFIIPEYYDYLNRVIGSIFSLNFGILFLPPILLVLFYLNQIEIDQKFIYLTIAMLVCILFLCLYPFWHGALGVSGQRYIAPFIIFYSLYVSKAVQKLLKTFPTAIFGISLLIFLYLPTINYRNTLSDNYVGHSFSTENLYQFHHEKFPLFDPHFHPMIYSLEVLACKYLSDDKNFKLKNSNNFESTFNCKKILPASGISRIIHLKGESKPRDLKISSLLLYLPLPLVTIISILTFLSPFLLIYAAIIFRMKNNENL
jgi:hypothetical protein